MTPWQSSLRGRCAVRNFFYRPRVERLEDRSLPSFIVAGSYPAGKEPRGLAVADFRGNGTLDLAVACFLDNSVNVLFGNGDGSFQSPMPYPVGKYPVAVAVGDFNGDGIPDLAVGTLTNLGFPTVSVLLGNGDGTFQAAKNYGVSSDPVSVAVGDFNGDGIPDLAVGSYGVVSILLGNGDGSFQHAVDYKNGQNGSAGGASVTVADFNGDSVQDVAVANYLYGNTLSVLLGNGDGTFQGAKSYYAGYSPEGLGAADLSGNGILDLVSANYASGNDGKSMSVLLGNGDGSFQAPVQYDSGIRAGPLVVGDWNGDGVPDVAVGNDTGVTNTVHTFLGNGDGTFQAADSYNAGKSPYSLAVGDFNGDGSPDLVTADYYGDTVTVLVNANDWGKSFVVTNTNDAGPGSLRQVIKDANASADLPTISFAIPGSGPHTIEVSSPLPDLTRPMIVDGATQPGYTGQPLIVVDGASAGDGADGLTITAASTTVKGLAIDDFTGPGIRLKDNGGDVIVANYLGTDATGSETRGNQTGIRIDTGSHDRIGGVIGVERNVISGNRDDGIAILGGSGHQILGNFIGTDATGTKALPNDYGIELFSGSYNTIGGGSDAGAGNLISGNVHDAVGIYSDGNTIQGNRIGTNVSGTLPLANGQDGVEIQAFLHGFDNLIGGTAPGAGNVIAFNGGYGVRVTMGTGNAIRQNAIFANSAGGIALLTGGNHNEPAPALTSAISGSWMTTVEGSVMGDPSTELAVEFFANTVCDPSGFGQGERYLDTAAVTTDSGGQADFTVTLNQEIDPGQFITATATDPAGNTSTFSNCQVVSGADTPGHLITGTTAHRGTSTPQFLPGVASPSPNTHYVGGFAFVLEAGALVPIPGYTSVTPGSRRPATAVAEATVPGDRPTANDAIVSGRQETFTAFDDLLVTIGEASLNDFC
jgi:hypothetical protein